MFTEFHCLCKMIIILDIMMMCTNSITIFRHNIYYQGLNLTSLTQNVLKFVILISQLIFGFRLFNELRL